MILRIELGPGVADAAESRSLAGRGTPGST